MHFNVERVKKGVGVTNSTTGFASLRRSNGRERASASRRREQGSLCKDTTAGTESASLRREQCRLCIATAAQRQRQTMHRYGESRADYYTLDYYTLRRSNGSDISCIGTARAAQTMQRYNGATEATEHRDGQSRWDYPSLRRRNGSKTAREQPRLSLWRSNGSDRAHLHRDAESRADCARIQRSNGSDRAYASQRRDQGRPAQRQRQSMHSIGKSRED